MNNYLYKITNILKSLIKFDISFIDSHHEFFGDPNVYNDIQKLMQQTSLIESIKILVFPLMVNNSFSGCFVIKTHNLPTKDQIALIRRILENSINYVTKDNNLKVNVLNYLEGQPLKDYLFILKSKNSLCIKHDNHHLPNITNVENALTYINKNISKPLNLDIVAKQRFISPTYLTRILKYDLNINFIDYINISKINLAQEKLIQTDIPIIELSNELGFAQASYFTKLFKRWVHVTPSEYRQKNKNIKSIYTIFRSGLWSHNMSVFEISKRYFANHNIPIKIRKVDSNNYICSINNLENKPNHNSGWIYTVDCLQPTVFSNKLKVNNKSVIQWMYINNH